MGNGRLYAFWTRRGRIFFRRLRRLLNERATLFILFFLRCHILRFVFLWYYSDALWEFQVLLDVPLQSYLSEIKQMKRP